MRSLERGIAGQKVGQPLLVPLTTSLYVPGRLADTEKVLVDVGTGFFVEKVRWFACVGWMGGGWSGEVGKEEWMRKRHGARKMLVGWPLVVWCGADLVELTSTQTIAEANTFYNDKTKEIGKNLKDLESILQGKSNNLRMVEDGMLSTARDRSWNPTDTLQS